MNPKNEIHQLAENKQKIILCGIGNDIKGDDAVGPYITNQVKETNRIKTIDCGKNPENHIKKIVTKKPDLLLLIDSTKFGGEPGDIVITKPSEIEKTTITSHRMPLPIFIEILNERIKNLETILIGIQPQQIVLGKKMSKPVKQTAENIIEIINTINTDR
ncbi:hydrogenase 3 maturation endopeptidase HyCI [Methanonatronarchaeum sp. AMET-Sl]|uniref:hydrogenase 3 maturation endopeptidase HyCI n=1 Tax=Methanonatronarchaeum sp. AMET-Sl TaxID=3037654 RepID=UPI00244E15C6|nr:hydrogenase 3 maturation endopeptidase HyCI [Methanonatronarchaeum sp. AMET-Sl]WGI17194.1 hydrogenase 3 maturation endopeptidase HyCI [Methanonatronarchaeum sp. AMET-Sl]